MSGFHEIFGWRVADNYGGIGPIERHMPENSTEHRLISSDLLAENLTSTKNHTFNMIRRTEKLSSSG